MARNRRTSQHYPTFALLATLFGNPLRGDAEHGAIFPAVAADKTDQPGVLGNLPRSRPGQRSNKRGGAVRAAATATAADAAKASGRNPAAARAKPARRKPATASKPAATAKRKPAATRPRARKAAQPRPRPQRVAEPETAAASSSTDPLTTAVRAAGKVAEVGLKTAGSLLRRLPGR
ncbi:MAG: hypothetical protein QOF65_2108 [Thermoleophilaceae bacterium]|nr:hypothetical protein [Thermoleophilaceae bacterium]